MQAIATIIKAPKTENLTDTIKGALYLILSLIVLTLKLSYEFCKLVFKTIGLILAGMSWIISKINGWLK